MKLSKVRRWVVELEERLSLIPEKVFSSTWFILAPPNMGHSTFSTVTRSSVAQSQENEAAGPSSRSRREEPGWNFSSLQF